MQKHVPSWKGITMERLRSQSTVTWPIFEEGGAERTGTVFTEGKLLTPSGRMQVIDKVFGGLDKWDWPKSHPRAKGSKEEFELYASKLDKSGFQVPVFLCQVSFDVLLKDLQDKYGDLIMRKKADLDERTKANPSNPQYAGWKVGDTLQAITDGNFE
jgi:hypothetical protein